MKKFVLPLITEESNLPFYVYCVGGMENQVHIDRRSGYPHYIWLHTVKGKGKLRLQGKETILRANTGVLLHTGVPHEYHALEEPWETHWVAFQGFAVAATLRQLGLQQSGVFHIRNLQALDRKLNEIFIEASSRNPDGGFKCSSKLYSFLIELKHCVASPNTRSISSGFKRLEPLLAYIEEKFHKEMTLEEMAGVIEASPQYLCRLFKYSMQMTPIAYLTRFRVQKAKEILLGPQAVSVSETAKSVGYRDTSYFCSVFKQYEGTTPLEFRKYYK